MNRLFNVIHKLFVPSEKNNFRAKTLHLDFLSAYLIVAVVLAFTFKTVSTKLPLVLGFATDITVEKLYEQTNAVRTKEHLSKLQYSKTLSEAAQKKANDMFTKNYWSHFGPTGETPWQFILDSGYHYEFAGENLAKNFLFTDGVIKAWMDSPTHRENLLKKEYTEVGFATVNGMLNGEETTLVVQMLAKPQTQAVAQVQENTFIPAKEVQAAAVENVAFNNSTVNVPKTTFNMQIVFFGFLILVLAIDFVIAARSNVVRINGKNIAHMIFLGTILLGMFILARGKIL